MFRNPPENLDVAGAGHEFLRHCRTVVALVESGGVDEEIYISMHVYSVSRYLCVDTS